MGAPGGDWNQTVESLEVVGHIEVVTGRMVWRGLTRRYGESLIVPK